VPCCQINSRLLKADHIQVTVDGVQRPLRSLDDRLYTPGLLADTLQSATAKK